MQNLPVPEISICRWRNDAPFAYSMTYDEGTVDCLANALPVHEKFGFPGHVDVVAGQLGQKRNAFASSLNGYVHMSPAEIKALLEHGWGVGNHSWSHYDWPVQPGLNLYREVVWSKYRLEDMLDIPVRIFTIPNYRGNYPPVIDLVKQHYLACAYMEHAPNRGGFDLYKIGNIVLGSEKWRSDDYDWKEELLTQNLGAEFLAGCWLYETTHMVMWNTPQAWKNMTPKDLTHRFARLQEISEGKLWTATPDDVIDYEMLRRALCVQLSEARQGEACRFIIEGEWPVGVVNTLLTLRVRGLNLREKPVVKVVADTLDGAASLSSVESVIADGSDWLITMDAISGRTVALCPQP